MKTTVVNVYHLADGWQEDPQYVYIGRPGKGKDGPFGNPIRLLPGNARGTTIAKYRTYLLKRLYNEPDFMAQVMDLYGKTLVCFCKPQTCHGDILAEAADALHELDEEEQQWALEELDVEPVTPEELEEAPDAAE
jgi:hypothetical protein